MHDFLAQTVAELRALGLFCLIHGPEAWLALEAPCVFTGGFVCGMFVTALLAANGRDDDNERH